MLYFLTSHSCLNPLQSGFHLHRVTKTAQVKITKEPHVSKFHVLNSESSKSKNEFYDLYVRIEPVLQLFPHLAVQMWASCSLGLGVPLPAVPKDRYQRHVMTPELIRGSSLLLKRDVVNQKNLIIQMKHMGTPLFILISFFPLVPKLK